MSPEIQTLIKKIKQKKELSDLPDSFIRGVLEKHINKYKIVLEKLKKQDEKILVKEIRSGLRLYTGRFRKSFKDRKKLLEENKIPELLKTHSSTSERLDFYPKLIQIIKKLKINSMLDLACGLNPIALAPNFPKAQYQASDIKKSELELIKMFFRKNKIKGDVFEFDLMSGNSEKLPKSDLSILFKILDIIPGKHKISANLLKELKCTYFLISFPKITLSGKKMKFPRRLWFERILQKLNLSHKTFSSNNEIFYLVGKNHYSHR